MSDTPETDALTARHFDEGTDWSISCDDLERHAKKLERERDEARNIARWLYQHGMATLKEGAHRRPWVREVIQ